MEKLKKILIINNEKDPEYQGWIPQLQKAFTQIEKVNFLTKHYSEISLEVMDELNPQYIILTGRIGHHWEVNEVEEKYLPKLKVMEELKIPILGICAGLQLISVVFGGEMGRMVESDENILEEGYIKHVIKKENMLFSGLNQTFYCRQFHRDEVKVIPQNFELLASSDMCEVQAIKHKNLPIYGVQFHPEWYNDQFPDGKRILENFLSIDSEGK